MPLKKEVITLKPEALKNYFAYLRFQLAKNLFVYSFIFINIAAFLLFYKKIGEKFDPSFARDVRYIWWGMWGLVGGTRLFDFLFPKRKSKSNNPEQNHNPQD